MFEKKAKSNTKLSAVDEAIQRVLAADARTAELSSELAVKQGELSKLERQLADDLTQGSSDLDSASNSLMRARGAVDLIERGIAALKGRRGELLIEVAHAKADALVAESKVLLSQAAAIEAEAAPHWEALGRLEYPPIDGEPFGCRDISYRTARSEELRRKASILPGEAEDCYRHGLDEQLGRQLVEAYQAKQAEA